MYVVRIHRYTHSYIAICIHACACVYIYTQTCTYVCVQIFIYWARQGRHDLSGLRAASARRAPQGTGVGSGRKRGSRQAFGARFAPFIGVCVYIYIIHVYTYIYIYSIHRCRYRADTDLDIDIDID